MHAMRSAAGADVFRSWATPYALSIDGNEYYDNCPFKTGNGYGDGRAISIAEVLVPPAAGTAAGTETGGDQGGQGQGQRWELQMKGAGRTPFCRGGDGRAVLRSSVREFLASEAMHHLGVGTTRALSLITSQSEEVSRAWFHPAQSNAMAVDDPRIASYPLDVRRQIVREVNGEPNLMVREHVAISCRVAPSFMRVGHIELFSRRYRSSMRKGGNAEEQTLRRAEFRLVLEHMLFREFGGPAPLPEGAPDRPGFQADVLLALRESSKRIATMTADWMRVGYCQGNFNSDNCLVGGRTMDYGPFGFVERYEKAWNMWSGGGVKYSFRHQHSAGERNFFSLASAAAVYFDAEGRREVEEDIIPGHLVRAEAAVRDVYRRKLGIATWCGAVETLFSAMDACMEETEADYTMFYRQLCSLPELLLKDSSAGAGAGEQPKYSTLEAFVASIGDKDQLLAPFKDAFYRPLGAADKARWASLLAEWLFLLQLEVSPGHTGADISAAMRRENPKYVPREWMLVDAYSAAAMGDYAPVHRLQKLFLDPYALEEGEDESENSSAFYRKMPAEYLGKGGVAVMT
jgi:uncharacterized protein YdiU (UPF0061 family)